MRTRSLCWTAVLLSSVAFAQAKELKEKPPAAINEIERGFYIGISAGYWALVNPPAGPGSKSPFSPGQTAQMELGYDFAERLSVGIFVQATANRAGSEYTGKSQDSVTGAPQASGDFTAVIPGATVRIGIAGFKDSQEVKRGWFYVRAGAGFVIYQPKKLLPGPDVLIFAGPGLEYFTRLRHFSIGLEADFVFMALNQSLGFQVTPMLRYAF